MLALHIPRSIPAAATIRAESQPGTLLPPDPAPVIGAQAAPTLPRYWPSMSGSNYYQLPSAPQGGSVSFCRGLPGNMADSLSYPSAPAVTPGFSGPRAPLGQQWSFIHEGSRVELEIAYNPAGFLLRVDNRFVQLDPHRTDGYTLFSLDFGSYGRRRIDLISWNLAFGGVFAGATDSIHAAELRGPRAIVFGDSFTTPLATNWSMWFGHALGWDDVWPSGVGGTGFVADALGTSPALPDRVLSDIVPYRPEVVFVHAGLNDLDKPPAAVESAARLTVERIRSHLPETLVAGGADTAFGIEAWSAEALDVMDAIRTGMERGGATWLSPVELPLAFGGTPIGSTATLAAPVSAGQPGNDGTPASVSLPNGILCNTSLDTPSANLRVGSVVEIGTGQTRERIAITCTGYAYGLLVFGFDGAMRYAHAAGEPVREVGPCFVTGSGSELAPNGWGSADRYVGSDGFHYSDEGQRALGAINAMLLRQHLRGRALI